MSRQLLHTKKLDEFITWCNLHGIHAYKVDQDYQVARVRIQDKPTKIYACIYTRHNVTEHLTVDRRLESIVRRYIRWTKEVKEGVLKWNPIDPPPMVAPHVTIIERKTVNQELNEKRVDM